MTEEQEEIHRSCHAQTDIPNYKINIPISHRCNHVILTWESIQLEFICEEETFMNNFYSKFFPEKISCVPMVSSCFIDSNES